MCSGRIDGIKIKCSLNLITLLENYEPYNLQIELFNNMDTVP
jgi:hypothetical protein